MACFYTNKKQAAVGAHIFFSLCFVYENERLSRDENLDRAFRWRFIYRMIEMFLKWISYIFVFVGCGGLSFSTFFFFCFV